MKTTMRMKLGLISALMVSVLAACGGGEDNDVCAAENQSFSIEFEESTYAVKVGQAMTIESKVFPESCRGDMSFAVRNGELPAGMALMNGNIDGTPETAGEYKVQIMISGVKGYQSTAFADFNAPRSQEITINVRR